MYSMRFAKNPSKGSTVTNRYLYIVANKIVTLCGGLK